MAGATTITHAKTRESAADAKHPVHSTARQASSTAFHAAGNLQLQGVLSEDLLQGRLNGDNPDDSLQQKALERSARPGIFRNHGITSLEQNNRQSANFPRRSSSHAGFGSNLVSTCTEHGNAVTSVQTKCATCEAEEASTEDQPVQLWDCTDLTEPTCVQSKQAMAESPMQRAAEAEDEQREEEPVQAKCAACEAEDAATKEEPVQSKCAGCDAEEAGADQEAEQEPVQLWDCTDLTEPTCVQTKCTDCQDEEPVQQDRTKAPARSANLIHHEAKHGLSNASSPLPHADRIQVAFGHHDVSHVRSSVGGSAETANQRIGALAFTSGPRIAFRQSPDLHLAAHEAAHVVQQREGLSLPGNVGRAGDRWERHADRVADAVVGGRSAEGLLNEVAKPNPSGRQAGASGETAAQEQIVQHRFASGATHLIEPPPRVPAMPTPSAEGKGKEGAAGKATGPAGGGEAGSALEAAKEGGEGETPPVGITVGGAVPAPGGTGTPATAGTPPPASAPEAPAAPGGGGGINAPCYNVDPPPPPENAPEPSSDERSGESQEEPRVIFDAWRPEPDQCPPRAMTQGAQQVAGSMGPGAAPAAGVAPAAGGVVPSAAATPPATAKSSEGGGTSAGAAKAEAEPGAEAPSSMSSSIGSAESGRDGAVIEYETEAGSLDAVLIRTRNLEQGVTFTPGGEGAKRDKAVEQVQSFMRRAAEQVAGAVTFAREQVPARLGGLAEATKANIQAAIESEKLNISARIVQARLQAMIAAQMARAHVHAEYAGNVALIEAETTAAIAALDAQHTSSLDQVDQKETTGLEDVNSRFAMGRKQHEDKGPEYSNRAITRGQEHAHQYERYKGDYSDDGFWDGCLTVRRAKAQQDAACKTAAGYKKTFLRTANKKGYDLKELRTQYRCAVIEGARQVNKTLDDTHDKLVSGLESGRKQALEGLGFARTQNLAAIDKALAATVKALSAQEHAQRQAVNDAGYVNQLSIEQLAHASAANLARGISAAMDSLDQSLTGFRERIAGSEVPDPATLAQILANIETSLGGGMGTLLGTMEMGAASAEGSIANSGAAALNGLAGLTAQNDELSAQSESGFGSQMSGLMAGASRAFGQLTKNHVQKAKQSATEGTTAMKKAVAGFDESLGTIGGKIDEALGKSLKGLEKELSDKLGELDGQIAREAWKAAEKEQPAWKKVLAIVLIIVVIIAAAVISIVTLGAGASLFAVILVGALVGAVSAGLIQILNNWASGETWHEGLVTAMVMGAIGGAIGGGLGFAGGALASGAAAAGARAVTQLAITVTSDLVAEGLTQTVGYFAFGQQFNWQGFVMAGAMSGVSFRAHPSVPHPPSPHAPTPHAATPHTSTPRAGAPHAEAPPVLAPRAPSPATRAGAAAARRGAVGQVAGGALVGLGIELAASAITGEKLDPTRIASAAASAAVAARMSRMHGGRAPEPRPEPTTRAGRALERFRTFDPSGVGARLGERLEGFGGRMFGARPEIESPLASRAHVTDEPPTSLREEALETGTRPQAAETEPSAVPRRGSIEASEGEGLFPRLTDAEIEAAIARAEAGPLVRVEAGSLGADTRPAPTRATGEATLQQRQRAGALHDQANALMAEANGLVNRAISVEEQAGLAEAYNPRRARALREEAARMLDRAADLEQRASAVRREAEEFASGRRPATEDLPGPEDIETMFTGLQAEASGLVRVPLSDVERNPALLPRLVRPLLSGESGGRMVFRVESERSRSLVHVDAQGNVRVEGGAAAHLNFGSFERAVEFVMQNSQGNARIIRFEVDENWVRAARSAAIPEHETAPLAGRQPRLVDVRFAEGQLEIPGSLINELNRFILPGSGVAHDIPAPRTSGTPGGSAPPVETPAGARPRPTEEGVVPRVRPREQEGAALHPRRSEGGRPHTPRGEQPTTPVRRSSQELIDDVERLRGTSGADSEILTQLNSLRNAIEEVEARLGSGEINEYQAARARMRLQEELEFFNRWAQEGDLRWIRGSEVASPELRDWVGRQQTAKGELLKLTEVTRRHERWLDWMESRTNAEMSPGNPHILHRENPRKIEILEEVLHHVQDMVPDFEMRFPYPVYELHVKDFMIRHHELFGLTPHDVETLQRLMKIQMASGTDTQGRPLVLPRSAEVPVSELPHTIGRDPFLDLWVDDIQQMMQREIDEGLDLRTSRETQ